MQNIRVKFIHKAYGTSFSMAAKDLFLKNMAELAMFVDKMEETSNFILVAEHFSVDT